MMLRSKVSPFLLILQDLAIGLFKTFFEIQNDGSSIYESWE